MSDDDKHKLYQAATMTGDTELLRRVSVKLGLMNDDFSPGDEYAGFLRITSRGSFKTPISFSQ
jgi:hypothetical protein